MDADIAKKYADTGKIMADIEANNAKVGIEAAKVAQAGVANGPNSKPATQK